MSIPTVKVISPDQNAISSYPYNEDSKPKDGDKCSSSSESSTSGLKSRKSPNKVVEAIDIIRENQKQKRKRIIKMKYLTSSSYPHGLNTFRVIMAFIACVIGLTGSAMLMCREGDVPLVVDHLCLQLVAVAYVFLAVSSIVQTVQYWWERHLSLFAVYFMNSCAWICMVTSLSLSSTWVGEKRRTTAIAQLTGAAFLTFLSFDQHFEFLSFAGPFGPIYPSRHAPTIIPVFLFETLGCLCLLISCAFTLPLYTEPYDLSWVAQENGLLVGAFTFWTVSTWGSLNTTKVANANAKRRAKRIKEMEIKRRAADIMALPRSENNNRIGGGHSKTTDSKPPQTGAARFNVQKKLPPVPKEVITSIV